MKIVLSWLREYCSWNWSEDELVEKLTLSGTEVESVSRTGFSRENFVAAKVLVRDKHPNADRLSVCQVDDGSGSRQIVCGAQNFKAGDIVPLALPGAKVPAGFEIKESKLRGEKSSGMLCSSKELELPGDEDGLMILSPDTKPGTPLSELFKGETVFEVEVTPNRPDLLSYTGLARELVALGAKPMERKPVRPEGFAASGGFTVESRDAEACPRYTARLLEHVKVGASPAWLKARLEAQGLRPVNNVVDITNYVLFELGQPLHAFDADLLQGKTVYARRAATGEKIKALNDKEYELQAGDLVIADAGGPVAIAGVMGGERSGVTEKTSRVLLESARFKPGDVRRTSRRLALISDSSYRFERGIDPVAVDLAMQRAVELLVELAGAKPAELAVQTSADVEKQNVVPLRATAIPRLLGYDVAESRVAEILQALGCRKTQQGWEVPSYRPDLTREVDLIEEIARIEGMEKVRGRLPGGVAPASPADERHDRERKIASALAQWGYYEMSTNSLLAKQEDIETGVNLLNPLTADHAALRADLLATVLPCVRHNLAYGVESVKGFEIGTVYHREKGRLAEERHLLIVGAGADRQAHWSQAGQEYDYFSLKGVLESLASHFPEIKVPEKFGAVDPTLARNHGIKVPIYAAELALSALKRGEDRPFSGLPAYPSVKRDLAFVVDRKVAHAELLQAIRSAGVAELEAVECFDVFSDAKDEKLGTTRKSLAYALTYRSRERTLTEKDVSGWERQIVETVRKQVGAELRT
ncbi:MAG: phenylalanine--tRNA ligase subunit beta [Methylacidiphilales bacterium]|nr:phenylalanine--tRNA ligase subunit beta [Candidatus Methylacidiphilales bacterium]